MDDPNEITITATKPRRRRALMGALAFAGLLAVGAIGTGIAAAHEASNEAVTAAQVQTQDDFGGWGDQWSLDDLQSLYDQFEQYWGGSGGYDPHQDPYQDPYQGTDPFQGTDPYQGQQTPGTSQEEATQASASESTGVVIINTELGYSGGEAAGTGMILSSDGYVLTNNHVIASSTEITVTDPSTGKTYTATLVGADPTHDVALLKLNGASGLATITVDQDDTEAVGDAITAVGNASGGGVLMAADGTITNLDASVTTSTTQYETGETLTGTIEISADVVPGDSGGALLDSDGEVIGMNTAASSGSTATTAYAITIEDALAIAKQIKAGDESGTVVLGYPAFLGIGLAQSGYQAVSGASVGAVYDGTPAAKAGIEAGDTITAVNGTKVASGDALAAALAKKDPGDKVKITWTDTNGTSHSKTVTLAEGPAK
jgi:S1-C subfamily serine protease